MNPTGKGGFRDNPQNINKRGTSQNVKQFLELRILAQRLAEEKITGIDGVTHTNVEMILRDMMHKDGKTFLEIAYGKVPQPVEHTGENGEPITIIEIVKDYGNT